MKYRVITNGVITDFDTKPEADTFFASEKTKVQKSKITKDKDGKDVVPTTSVHACYHDEPPNKPCVITEEVKAVAK